jgi:3-dehydroquinate dehydratase-2
MALRKILVLNGPNLNLLGTREPETYGATTLAEVEAALQSLAGTLGVAVECFQSNHEGALIDRIQAARLEGIDAFIINPGGLTHTSVALRDAFAGVAIPFVEVHVSNIHKREEFRHHSFLSGIAQAVIAGCGVRGYGLALRYLIDEAAGKPIGHA